MLKPADTLATKPDSWVYPFALRDAEAFHGKNRQWAARQAARLPASFQQHVMAGWDDRYGIPLDDRNRSIVALANTYAAQAVKEFGDARASRAYDEQAITEYAENYSRLCGRMKSLQARATFAASFGIEPPNGPRITPAGAIARLDAPKWWRRQLRKVWTRAAEDGQRRAGAVRKGRAPYASDDAVRHRANQQRRTRDWLETRVMVNGEGEQLKLIDLHEKSVANPALRRGEFMCRMRGFEEVATEVGHVALFFTLTTPSAFHAQHSGGGVNHAWEKAGRPTVRDGQMWLRKRWELSRAKLARLSIMYYGFRVAEPHHDGTPHWHMVLFVKPADAATLRTVLAGVWLSEYGDEPGAAEHRTKCERIEPGKGSATGYIAKYVAKNIDGAGAIGAEISDETGAPVIEGVARVAAWASCHSIRQFTQLGGPPVGLWRELRRQRTPVEAEAIEGARAAADAGKWADFITALGGLERAKKRVHCVSEKYRRACNVTPETAHKFPAVWMDKAAPMRADAYGREVLASTSYGELPADRACGVVSFGLLGRWASVNTRPHRWRIERAEGTGTDTAGVRTHGRIGRDGRIHERAGSHRLERGAGVAGGGVGGAGEGRGLRLGSESRSGSALGPVAITVRDAEAPSLSDPAGWICRETSTAGPESLQ